MFGRKKPPPPTRPVDDDDPPDPVPGPLAFEWRISLVHRWFPRPADPSAPDLAEEADAPERDDAS